MFNASTIPPVYHPACAMLVDDSETFLMSLSLGLDEDIPYISRSNPRQALEELKQHLFDPVTADIKTLLANPYRFSGISVAVVDKSMPGMDGIDFCSQLDPARIKTILLTGMADASSALHAIRSGIIDAYINKGELSALHKLNYAIKEFSAQQFARVYAKRTAELGDKAELLKQEEFVRIFQALCKQHAIIEFYLLEQGLQFLLLDQQANTYLLTFFEPVGDVPSFTYPFLSIEGTVRPESLMGINYDYLYTPVKCELPIYSYASYVKEIWPQLQSAG